MRRAGEQPTVSRQQKVLAAKAAFGNVEGGQVPPKGQPSTENGAYRERQELWEQDGFSTGPRFGLLRFMTAGMLLVVLVVAFHQGFSYQGFDQAYLQERLNDETAWNRLEKQVQQVYLSLEKQWENRQGSK